MNLKKIFKYTYRSKRVLLLILLCISCFQSIQASNMLVGSLINNIQDKTVTGLVMDESNNPLPEASIVVKGSKIGVTTDFNGTFSISFPGISSKNVVLIVSYLGYKTQEISVNGRSSLTIILKEDSDQLDEIVLIGYGSVSRTNLATSVGTVKSEVLKDLPVTGIDQALVAQLAGVSVVQESGEPGSNLSFRIRALTAISTSSEPLIVLDGIPLDRGASLSNIDPNTVETVNVLKDAAAAAIYGSRGSNGVVLINTKRGESGDAKYTFSSFHGFQTVSNKIKLQDAYGQAKYINSALKNEYIYKNPTLPEPTDPTVYGFPNELVPYLNNQPGLINTDWQDEIFRNGILNNYELSARGGNEKVRYYISGNYFDQEGVVISTDYERIAFRANIDVDLSNKLRIAVNLAPSFSSANRVNAGTSSINGFRAPVVSTAQYVSPFFSPYNANGDIDADSIIEGAANLRSASGNQISLANYVNPIALAKLNSFTRKEYRLLGSIALEYDFFKDITFKTQISTDVSRREDAFFKPSTVGKRNVVSTDNINNEIFANYGGRTLINWTIENTVNYDKKINDVHNFNLLLGYSAQKVHRETESISANNFPDNKVQTLNAGVITDGSTFISEYSLLSQLARLTYDYDNKYFILASIRRDGGSRFGENRRFGIFPAVGLAYRISNEDFFPKNKIFNDLKLRASWGKTGNFNIPTFGALARLGNSNYPLGGNIEPGLAISTSPNANLAWESTQTIDAGIDFSLFNREINVTVDYFSTKTDDLLFNLPVPGQSGFETTLQNVGSIKSNGIEISVNGAFKFGDFIWEPGANFSRNRHEVVNLDLEDPSITDWTWRTEEGGIVGAFWGYKNLGLITTQEQIDNNPTRSNVQIGNSYLWEDANGDGTINGEDKTIIGNPYPEYSMNFTSRFSYKGFDANIIVQSVQNFDVFWNAGRDRFRDQTLWTPKTVEFAENSYQSPENPGIYTKPFRSNQPDDEFYRDSDLNLFDGSFVRIKNITIGYTLPKSALTNLGLDKLRIYLSSNNPFTFTKYPGYDPEASNHSAASDSRPNGVTPRPGRDLDTYPTTKNFTLGINLNF